MYFFAYILNCFINDILHFKQGICILLESQTRLQNGKLLGYIVAENQ